MMDLLSKFDGLRRFLLLGKRGGRMKKNILKKQPDNFSRSRKEKKLTFRLLELKIKGGEKTFNKSGECGRKFKNVPLHVFAFIVYFQLGPEKGRFIF